MKKVMTVAAILLFTLTSFAQEETLFGDKYIEHGGFGGPAVKFTSINNEFGVLVGGRGGWVINHTLVIGGGGYGLVNEVDMGLNEFGEDQYLNFGYGGFEMEYVINSDELMHFTFQALIGAGGVSLRTGDFEDFGDNVDSFFITEPGVGLELNVLSYLRIHVGGSYRIVNGVKSFGLKDSDLSGPSASFTMKFGKF
ncbi:MAG: hypothetical protein KKA84_08315 [Bacteroidetes bacterium]|nr:hypothetical protein [Bacteroidota bacterium]